MSDIVDEIKSKPIPRHIAIIMDGNGRWAKKRGNVRVFGHKNAIKAVRESVETAVEVGIEFLTLYAFSTENWNRPKLEVSALMELLSATIKNERQTMIDNKVRLRTIGQTENLPSKTKKALEELIETTKNNKNTTLTLALSYGSRVEILNTTKKIAEDILSGKFSPEDINEKLFESYLQTNYMPDPELLIRTSGEQRISNYLLWQLAYSELYFTEKLWPDFRREDFLLALQNFQNRERRFGKTSEQLLQNK